MRIAGILPASTSPEDPHAALQWPLRSNQKVMRPDLLTLASNLAAREERFALVTVVRRAPPSSARVGDVAVVAETGGYYGLVGGGWTRSAVLHEARGAIADREPRLVALTPDP